MIAGKNFYLHMIKIKALQCLCKLCAKNYQLLFSVGFESIGYQNLIP